MIPTTISLDAQTALAPILAAVAATALKGALLVALAALAAATVLRRRSAAARHGVWAGALAAHLLLFVVAPLLPAVSLPVFRLPAWLTVSVVSGETTVPRAAAVAAGPSTTRLIGDPTGSGPASPPHIVIETTRWKAELRGGVHATPTASASANASTALASPPSLATPHVVQVADHKLASRLTTLWLVGVLLLLGRLLLGTARVRALAHAAERITDPSMLALAQRTANRLGIVRPITLLRGDRLSIPITWGVVYPTVLLPAESEGWPEERQRVVLVHEMAHVTRFDALTQLVAQLALAVFWFDPLVWLAGRHMRAERERACDDYVLRDGTRASLYANELLDIVRRLAARAGEAGAPAFAALAMARRSEFEGRMLAILDPAADRRVLSRAASAGCGFGALVLLMPLAALRPVEARPLDSAPTRGVAAAPTTTILTLPAERRSAAAASRSSASAVASTRALPAAAAAGQEKLPIIYSCTREDLRTRNTMHAIHTDHERAGRNFVEHSLKTYGHCVHVVLVGRVRFTADERDVESLSSDGRVQLRERTFDFDRALVVTSDGDGRLRRSYTEDGRPAPFDASAQAWAGRLIQDFARESGVDAPGRVSRIRARGGVQAVLTEIGEIRSAGAKRQHYEALLAGGGLTPGEVDLVIRHAGSELSRSSGDLRAVLKRVPPGGVRAVNAALEDAIGRMSDGDKHAVLVSMLDSADSPMLLVVLRLAERINSDGDKTSLLKRAAPRVLDGSRPAHREAFFRAYSTIDSDGDKQAVLVTALRQGPRSPALTLDVIRGAARINSDGDKASVLLAVARGGLLTTDELRAEYIKTARTIGSDGDYRAVIDAVLVAKSGG